MNFGNNYRTTYRYLASQFGASLQGQAFKNNEEYYDYTFDNILTYTKGFGLHDITATLLYGAIERQLSTTGANAAVFTRLNLGYDNLAQGQTFTVSSGGYREQLNYQMARINYKFNDRYLFTATIRRDGYSGFAENYKTAYFPTAAVGWVITQEKFMSKVNWVDFLKLRIGYGEAGNQTLRYSSLAIVSTRPWLPTPVDNNFSFPYIYGDGGVTSAAQQVTQLGNPDLKWERTKGLNLGVEFNMFKNRFTGSIDYYRNNVEDLLFRVNIPNITGFPNIQTNLGQMRNSGLELSLTYKIVDKRDFTWSASVNFWKNSNQLKKLTGQDLNGDGKEDDLVGSGLFIDRSRWTIFDYQYDGIYKVGDPRLPQFQEGAYRIVDTDKNGSITDADRVFLGRREAAYQFSIYNVFTYKALTFSFFINSIQGGKNGYLGNNNPSFFRDDNGVRNNFLTAIDYWSPSNPNGKYPRNVSGSRSYNETALNNWQDRSFIRLQDASLSYNLGSLGFMKKLKAQAINLYVSGKNLITITDWEGWDPEPIDNIQLNNVSGGLLGTRPVMRAITVGLNITY
jgi:TonB-linked SusC/RagA family outer membrane protein